MSNVDNKTFWSSVLLTKLSKLPNLLQAIHMNQESSQNELKGILNWSNGALTGAIRDAKNMHLIEKNGSLKLTNLGHRWLACKGEESEDIPPELRKESALKVEFFRRLYEQRPNDTSANNIFNHFRSLAPERVSNGLVGSVVRRYLESIHNMYSYSRERRSKKKKELWEKQTTLYYNSIKQCFKNKGFDNSEMAEILNHLLQIESFSEEKKKILIEDFIK